MRLHPHHLGQFFVDDAGECSCMRLIAFLVLVVVLGLWVWGCITAGTYVPLGYAEAGLLGSAIGGKAVQARFEYGGHENSPMPSGPEGVGNDAQYPAPSPDTPANIPPDIPQGENRSGHE